MRSNIGRKERKRDFSLLQPPIINAYIVSRQIQSKGAQQMTLGSNKDMNLRHPHCI